MDKIYTVKRYELKEIGLKIQNKSAEEKSLIKAQELAKQPLNNFSFKGYDIEILGQPIEENGLLKVSVKAYKDGKKLFVDNPLLYKNPPIMVHDGTYYKTTLPTINDEIDAPNFVEDPLQALKEIIVETIRILNK